MNKYCSGCKQDLPLISFGKNSCKGDNLSPYCKNCTKKHQQEVKALKKLYVKPDKCTCCNKITDNLLIDHDHETGKYRGWICRKCNTGIGMLGDNLEGILMAQKYLIESKLK